MDFDLDDPLGSDDSFFEEPKVLAKRPSFTKTPEKKSMENLLGVESKTKSSALAEESKKPESSGKKPMDDWLTIDTPKDKPKRSDFLDDILPLKPKPKSEKIRTSFEDILKESKVSTAPKAAHSLKDVSSLNPEPSLSSEFGISTTTIERRRGGRRGSGVEDTLGLGLFSDTYQFGDSGKDKKEPNPKPVEPFQKTSSAGVPDWLGLGTPTVKRSESPTMKRVQNIVPQQITTRESTTVLEEPGITKEQINPSIVSENKLAAKEHSSKLVPKDINADIQNTYSVLHQQESLLLVSLQFKKYEEVLNDIKEKQNDILGQQEKQFKNFIDDYLLKQHAIENNIKLQQERINNQIQLIVSDRLDNKNSDTIVGSPEAEGEQKEDSLHLLMRKLKERHDEELFLMEESYKKQMDMVEKSASNIEENLRNELKNLANLFDAKLKKYQTNNDEEISYYKEKISLLEEQFKNDIKLIKEAHAQKIEDLKSEHAIQIDYMREMKQKENNLLNDGHALAEKMDTGINMLGHNVQILQGVEEKVIQNYDVLAMAREQSMQSKEKEIILMKKSLEKCRESAENERSQLMSLVRNLELKLAEQSTNAQEDRWALQQASATLTARSKALERESEFSRNLIEREREQLKTLKESLLAEQEKMVMHLTEEKLQLAAEKAKFDTSTKITNSYEVERAKVEAETAINEAKTLTERLNQERSHLQRQKNELTSLKNNLMERERELEDKEAELEFLVEDTQRRLKEDKQVLSEAKRMESTYKERLKELQAQWGLLSNREKKLAEDKMLLSRERLALYTSIKASKDCVLCSAGGGDMTNLGKSSVLSVFDSINKSSDPTGVKIRFEALEDDESEVSKEGSVNR